MDQRVDQHMVKIGAGRRQAAFVFIFATVLLDMLAMGIIIPVLPKLVVDFTGGDGKLRRYGPANIRSGNL